MSVKSPAPTTRSIVLNAMNDPALDWTRTSPTRRRLVLASMALTATLLAVAAFALHLRYVARHQMAWWALGTTGVLMIGWFVLTGWLNASIRGTADPLVGSVRGGHDEWQRQLHDRTYRQCYWPMLAIMSVAMLTTIVLKLTVVPALAVFLGGYLLSIMAPLWVMAWTLTQDLRDG